MNKSSIGLHSKLDMIANSELLEIGKFQKTHGLQGELNVILDQAVDGDFLGGENPVIIDIDGINVPFYPESVRTKGAESYLLKLRGVDSQAAASAFVNKTIFARRADLASYLEVEDGDLFTEEELIGYDVIDKKVGRIGKVVGIDDNTENILLVVENKAGEDVFVPFVDDFIEGIDEGESVIHTELPDGLVDLNSKEE